ncbi:MAG: hypothetical protein E7651_04290 [Ruminococcaceae bacterium]|nr:hypothetical protein [Oscillospiraceae bacterium]
MIFQSSPKTKNALALDLTIAMIPVTIWAIYLFGARAAVLMLIAGGCAFALDFLIQKLILWRRWGESASPFSFLAGVLTMLWFPVTVPLYFPMIAGGIVAVARSLYIWFGHRIFCPSALSAVIMGLVYPFEMTRFTKPFAYFDALQWEIDPALVSAYQVKTPFDVLIKGTMYEDGALPQLYGFASGAMGAVAILCLLLGGAWLLYRKLISWYTCGGFVVTLLVLAMAFAPEEVEMTAYGYLYLLCGGIALGAVFPLNDPSSTPRTKGGKLMFGMLAAAFTFLFRKYLGVDGVLYAVLCCNLLTPLLEGLTQQKDYYRLRRKDIVFAPEPPLPSPAEEQAEEPAEEPETQTDVLPETEEVTVMDMNDEEATDEQE